MQNTFKSVIRVDDMSFITVSMTTKLHGIGYLVEYVIPGSIMSYMQIVDRKIEMVYADYAFVYVGTWKC